MLHWIGGGLMLVRVVTFAAALILMAGAAQARRVALVIGQNAYPAGNSATAGLPSLDNPVLDARRMAELLGRHGFEMITCDGKTPDCFDLNRIQFLQALTKLEQQAAGADLALVFFAGHGMATEEGNILTPIDAKVNCATGGVTQGVTVERIMAATKPARHKLVILDACRNNPLGEVCPGLKDKKLAFTRIEAGAMQGLLLVTSTQFGQSALDGLAGTHSPFARALFTALEASPGVYFEQVMNEVARATYDAAQRQGGFLQIPGKVVGGAAPADCLAGKSCVGDARMAALAVENERLATDAAGVRNLLTAEERARGKPYNAEERAKRVSELEQTLARIGTSTDPLRQEARRLIGEGNIPGGQAKLDEALDADEKAMSDAHRLADERRKAAARSARDLAVLAHGTDVAKAIAYYLRATRLDPSDPATWTAYGRAALDAGRTDEGKAAFEQSAAKAEHDNNPNQRYWAILSLGDVAVAQGDLARARQLYEMAVAIAEPIAWFNPSNADWQRDLSVSHNRIASVLQAQGNLPAALDSYRAGLAIIERLVKSDPANTGWQRDLWVSHDAIADVLQARGDLTAALDSYRAGLAIIERLAKSDPANAGWQRDLSMSHDAIAKVLQAQGNLSVAMESYRAGLAVAERLAKADPGNAGRQRNLFVSQNKIANVLQAQGNLTAALDSYRAGLAIVEQLTRADPANARWQHDLCVSHYKIASMLHAQGNLTAALDSYRAGLAIIERLVKADPTNAGWQRDLFASQNAIANVLHAQGNLSAALDSFRAGLAIVERLAKSDLTDAGWQGDLRWSHNKIGDVLRAQGNLSAALDSYRSGLAIVERLATSDPTNADWQFDLGTSNEHVGDILLRQGIGVTSKPHEARSLAHLLHHMRRCSRALGLCNVEPALKHYRAKSEIIERLAASDPSNAEWRRDLASSHGIIGEALHAQGNLSAALDRYRAGLAIVEQLATTDPTNASWQADLAISHVRVAMVLAAQGQPEHALKTFHLGRGILTKLESLVPNSLVLQDALRAVDEQIAELEKPSGRAETAKSAEGGDTPRSRTASDGSLPADKKVAPKSPRKVPMTWQQELWRRQ
jgi:tetratricopeptide (TPR) repeat protein